MIDPSTPLFAALPSSSGATFSPCRRYRYTLWRSWSGEPDVAFCGLNPSTADETIDDPTIRRIIGFAKAWGYHGVVMLNAFAFRATDPKVMKAEADPVGPENDLAIRVISWDVDKVVACWGTHGSFRDRDMEISSMLCGRLYCLGTNADGSPKHPLYLRGDSALVPWRKA